MQDVAFAPKEFEMRYCDEATIRIQCRATQIVQARLEAEYLVLPGGKHAKARVKHPGSQVQSPKYAFSHKIIRCSRTDVVGAREHAHAVVRCEHQVEIRLRTAIFGQER